MSALKTWMDAATTAEQEILANEAGTTRNYLYQISAGHRKCGPTLAIRIENAINLMSRMNHVNPKLPVVHAEDLSEPLAAALKQTEMRVVTILQPVTAKGADQAYCPGPVKITNFRGMSHLGRTEEEANRVKHVAYMSHTVPSDGVAYKPVKEKSNATQRSQVKNRQNARGRKG